MQAAEDESDRLVAKGTATAQQINDLLGLVFEQDYPAVEASKNLQIVVGELESVAIEYLSIEDRDALAPLRDEFSAIAQRAAPAFSILLAPAETEQDVASIT